MPSATTATATVDHAAGTAEGSIVSALGHRALVSWAGAQSTIAIAQGRDLAWVTGDRVLMDLGDPPVVRAVLPRRNCVQRAESGKTRLLAANVDAAWVVVSGSPMFSPDAMARLLVSLLAQDIPTQLLLTKADLAEPAERAWSHLQDLLPPALRHGVLRVSSSSGEGLDELRQTAERIAHASDDPQGAQILVVGQSGMGKSSLLNALIPGLSLRTQEISQALQTGRHTTTASTVHPWSGLACGRPVGLIDTPGFQRWGIEHLDEGDLALLFPDVVEASEAQPCRFRDCQHQREPGCGLLAWVQAATDEAEQDRRRARLERLDALRSGLAGGGPGVGLLR